MLALAMRARDNGHVGYADLLVERAKKLLAEPEVDTAQQQQVQPKSKPNP